LTNVKIGEFTFKEYAAKKPVSIKPTGEFVTAKEVLETPSLGATSMYTLGEDLQIKLTIERNKLEPNYKLGIIGMGIVTKDEVTEHVQEKTEFGLDVVRAEMTYLNELLPSLSAKPAISPVLPKPEVEPRPDDWKFIPDTIWKDWWVYFRNCALFCENTTDAVTKYAATYRKNNVHNVFNTRGFCLYEFENVNDVRVKIAPAAKNPRVVYISGIGHGSPTCYTGDLNQPIWCKGLYDPAEVKGKIIHLLSCQTAKELGPDLVAKGALAYAGYFENFTFVYDQAATPINEMELFWKADSTFDVAMALGKTAEEAHNLTMAVYNAAIAAVPGTAAATWLTWDRNYFRSPVIDPIYGSKTAKIRPWILFPIHPFPIPVPAP
jgi:hypothetical protein